ncbi:unknown [Spodoptera litura nucleopolyhedrovirus]|uniref:Uncharacterized protein n=1 Tax=Spodoptera litura multicapsid nucleopolyhedrovirus TaxID=46242 RepID=Q91BB6_NPVST|nr:hypothetical protein [Spodoptera litura nucleopolyhedrovirus]AAL01799.1 unknown [Spodoptera litura nucleopolyhedrovirus]
MSFFYFRLFKISNLFVGVYGNVYLINTIKLVAFEMIALNLYEYVSRERRRRRGGGGVGGGGSDNCRKRGQHPSIQERVRTGKIQKCRMSTRRGVQESQKRRGRGL